MASPARCPECGETALRTVIDVTVHPRLMVDAQGRWSHGPLRPGALSAIRRFLRSTPVRPDDDLICDGCGAIGSPAALGGAQAADDA